MRGIGNGAKMREALDEIRVAAMSDYEPDADYLIEKCNAALFAPPRNCDRLEAAAKHDAEILNDGETGGVSHRSRNGEREASARA